jgi:hypothetical protein
MEEETKRRSEGGEQMPYAEFARLLIDASSIDPEQWSLEKADAMQSVSNAISEFLYSDVPAFFDPAIADLQGGGKGMAKSAEELLKSSRAQSDAARNMQALSDSFAQSSGRLAAEAEALAGRVQLQAPVPTIPGLGFRPMPTIPANANGGIYSSPTFGVWAEDGDEAIIPLSPDKRGRGLGLWGEAGRRLGVEYFADGAIAARGSPPAAAAAGGGAGGGDDYSVTFAPGSVVFSVGAAATGQDIKKYAQILFDEMQRLQRVRQMATRKGSSVVSQLPAGAF